MSVSLSARTTCLAWIRTMTKWSRVTCLLLEWLLKSFAAGSHVNRNCRKFHLTAFASNFDKFARSQKYKKAHKGSRAAAISRKSAFGNAAILAAWQRSPRDVHCVRESWTGILSNWLRRRWPVPLNTRALSRNRNLEQWVSLPRV